MTDMEIAGRIMQIVLAGFTLYALYLGARLGLDALREFHQAGLARLAADARRTPRPTRTHADTHRIA